MLIKNSSGHEIYQMTFAPVLVSLADYYPLKKVELRHTTYLPEGGPPEPGSFAISGLIPQNNNYFVRVSLF